MVLNVEKALVTRVIEEGDVRSLIRAKITPEFFKDDESKEVITYILDRFERRRAVPTLKLIQREFPNYEPYDAEDDTALLIDEVRRESLYRSLSRAISDIVDTTKADPEEGFELLRAKAAELSSAYTGEDDEDITKTIVSVEKEYDLSKHKKGIIGLPWYWPYLNEVTGGRENGTFSAMYARPKSMKTWLSLADANYVHSQFGTVVGYASCEMPLAQVKRRLACLRAKVNYRKFRKGVLGPHEYRRFKESLQEIQDSPPFYIFKPQMRGASAITELRTKVEDYSLDLLWVDGFYILRNEDTAQGFRVITSGLKHGIAEACKIPVCGTTQANREFDKEKNAKSTGSVSFGDALAQDCDFLMAIIRTPEHASNNELVLDLGVALRESSGGKVTVHAIPCTDFSQKHVEREDENEEEFDDDKEPEDDDLLAGLIDNE